MKLMHDATPSIAILTCHPETHSQAVHRIEAQTGWMQGGSLALTYTLKGDCSRLRIPLPCPPRWADGLWQHTCFEAFIMVKDKPAYYEFNFSPSGEWAAYLFGHYRDGAPLMEEALAPRITVCRTGESLELDAFIPLDRLSHIPPHTPFMLALSAVVEEESGQRSYWALKHPSDKPDFHHPDAFTLELLTREQ